MKIILLLVLCISLYPASNTKDDCPSNIICGIAGRIWSSNFETFEFNISAMPEDCGIFLVAQFDFDRDSQFMDSDENIVTTLTSAGKIVYTSIGFHYDDNWPLVFEADESSTDYKTGIIDPLVTFLNANNISGVIINMDWIYDGHTDYPQKMSTFVTKIKQSVKHDLKFGLELGSWIYANFSCSECFDFSITNSVLDYYILDFYTLNICDSDGKQYGLAPITCKNPNMTTMEQVTAGISNSSMDQSKIYCSLGSSVLLPDDQSINDKKITSYSTYCSSSSISSKWCANPSELSYQQGQYAKKHFKGLVTRTLDTDDYNNSCNCGLFPVTNLFISGWKSTSLKTCATIDNIRKS